MVPLQGRWTHLHSIWKHSSLALKSVPGCWSVWLSWKAAAVWLCTATVSVKKDYAAKHVNIIGFAVGHLHYSISATIEKATRSQFIAHGHCNFGCAPASTHSFLQCDCSIADTVSQPVGWSPSLVWTEVSQQKLDCRRVWANIFGPQKWSPHPLSEVFEQIYCSHQNYCGFH